MEFSLSGIIDPVQKFMDSYGITWTYVLIGLGVLIIIIWFLIKKKKR